MNDIEKAIKKLKNHRDSAYVMQIDNNSCDLAISALEKQLNNGWIPTSERLPEETKHYNVTIKTVYETWCEFCLFDITTQKFYFVADSIEDEDKSWKEEATNIIAWQPLPELYKGEANAECQR